MKKYLWILIGCLISVALFYLAIAFIKLEINIFYWYENDMVLYLVMSPFLMTIVGIVIRCYYKYIKGDKK